MKSVFYEYQQRSSRNIKQANQEYQSKDSESNGHKLEEQAQ
jgi:hypothetical protein